MGLDTRFIQNFGGLVFGIFHSERYVYNLTKYNLTGGVK